MSPLSYEDGFHLRLGRLTHAVASLDVNIGFSLKWVANHYQQDVSHLLDGAKPMKLRLDKLEAIIKQTATHRQPQIIDLLSKWFKRAHEVRALRNDYVHARWGFKLIEPGCEPRVDYIPLTWEGDHALLPQPTEVTFSEFDRQTEAIHKLQGELYQLLVQHCDAGVAALATTSTSSS